MGRDVIRGLLAVLLLAWAPLALAGAPLKVDLDKSRVDLAARKLELRMNKAPGRVEIKVFGPGGNAALVEDAHDFTGHTAGETLTVTWPDPGGEIGRIDVRAYDSEGLWVGLSLSPWAIVIPHEEVNFATDSAVITAAEAPKLAASLALITKELAKARQQRPDLRPNVFIAGHTDTVGNPAYNLKLSQRRAQAIASWFRKHGLRIPVLFEGFGEQSLLIATPDQTDEIRNRRVDYYLADQEPPMKTTGFRPSWKRIP